MSLNHASTARARRADALGAAPMAAPRGPEIRLAAPPRPTQVQVGADWSRQTISPALVEAVAAFGDALDARLSLVESDEDWWAALTPIYAGLASGLPPREAARFELEADRLLARRGCTSWAVRQRMAKLGR